MGQSKLYEEKKKRFGQKSCEYISHILSRKILLDVVKNGTEKQCSPIVSRQDDMLPVHPALNGVPGSCE